MHVFFAAAAPELLAKRNVLKVESEVLCVALDLLEGSHFTGADHLVLVEQKDGDPSSGDKFVDLQAIGPQLCARVPVDRCFPNTMRLIHNQDVQAVRVSRHELVEILEQRPDLRGSDSSDFPERLGERA